MDRLFHLNDYKIKLTAAMSIIVSSPQSINQSPLNLSSTKAMYSFSRAERFKSNRSNL
jgi:hypothetical protein